MAPPLRLTACILGLSLLVATTDALGQTPEQEALATELFNAGLVLMAQERLPEACNKLAESARLGARVGTLAKLAECQERQGRLLSARTYWQQALNVARATADERLPLVEEEMRRVDRAVPKLKLIASEQDLRALRITLDALEIGAGSVGVALPMDAGAHKVEVTSPGKVPWNAVVDLKPDGNVTALVIPALQDVQQPVAPAPQPVAANDSSSVMPSVGMVMTGMGLMSLGVGAYFGGVAISKLDDSNALGCEGRQCTPQGAALRDDARDAGNLSTGFLIGGGVLALGGLGLWLLAPEGNERGVEASASVGPDAGKVWVTGRW